MKVRQNLEGVFLVAAALTIVTTYATAGVTPVERAAKPNVVTVAAVDASIPTVVVKGHRLSAAEKANQA